MKASVSSNYNSPFSYRRIAALVYDCILLIAILIIGTALLLFLTQGHSIGPGNLYYQAFLFLLGSVFFIGFWTQGGQTAGMAAWQLKLITLSGEPLSIKQAVLRLLIGVPSMLLGVGLIWSLFDKQKLTLCDRLSGTRIILVERKRKGVSR